MITECEKRDGLKTVDIRKLLKIDVNKTTKLYHHFLEEGLIFKPGSTRLDTKVTSKPNLDLKLNSMKNVCHLSGGTQAPATLSKRSQRLSSMDLQLISGCSDVIHTTGEIVLSHMKGYPWWPSLITTCPSSGLSYKDGHYFVLFLDGKKNDTAWISLDNVKQFDDYDDYLRKKKKGTRPALFSRIRKANRCAQEMKKWTKDQRFKYFMSEKRPAEKLYQSLLSKSKCSEIKPGITPLNLIPLPTKKTSISRNRSKKLHWRKRKRMESNAAESKIAKRLKEALPTEENVHSQPKQPQSDKDVISIEEDNDIALIVNELLTELYS